jgi:YVTN family beta-propeller protein
VSAGTQPSALAINVVTNRIYVANSGSNNVTQIDETTNTTTTIAAGISPWAVAVNPVTNKIYVANNGSNNVTLINGSTTVPSTINVGSGPTGIAVNAVTNKIYVANNGGSTVTVIDGSTSATTTVATSSAPNGIAVNPITNKIYVSNQGQANVTVIDGITNSTATVAAGTTPYAVAVNPVTGKAYVANYGSNTVSVITEATLNDTKINSTPDAATASVTYLAQPAITGKSVNHLTPNHTALWTVQSVMNTVQTGTWNLPPITSGNGTDSLRWNWSWGTDSLMPGENYLCMIASDYQAATSNNCGLGTPYCGTLTLFPLYRINQLPAAPTTPPVLLAPPSDTTNLPIVLSLSWGTVTNATYYMVQVATNSSFTALVYNSKALVSTSQSITIGNSTTYFWRALAGNAGGTTAWSAFRTFTTAAPSAPLPPSLSLPTNGATNVSASPILIWSNSASTASYGIQVSTVSTFATTVLSRTGITAVACTVSTALAPNKQHFWRVNATNTGGTSAWSAIYSFTTTTVGIALAKPMPIISAAFSCSGNSIHYALPGFSTVQLMCYDMQGRIVATLVNTAQSTGYYNISLEKAGLARGMYLLRFSAGSYIQSKLFSLIY